MLIDPITKAKPTNADLAKGINQIHTCFEDHKRITREGVAAAVRASADAAKKAAIASDDIATIREALGLAEGKKKVAGLSSPFKAFIRSAGATVTGVGALVLLYRFVVAVAPSAWRFLEALNHIVLSGKF